MTQASHILDPDIQLPPPCASLNNQISKLNPPTNLPLVKFMGTVDYQATWHAMQHFTARRTANTRDEIWMLQHPPTYTQGQAGKPEHLLKTNHTLSSQKIPIVQIDRGGQITYHGPGQIVTYLLLDLRRWQINVRQLVRLMEQSVVDVLAEYSVLAQGPEDAPGVYVDNAKIAALGLKIKNGCCYHGLALNIDMDLSPYAAINPCGFAGLQVTQARNLGVQASLTEIEQQLANRLLTLLQQHKAQK